MRPETEIAGKGATASSTKLARNWSADHTSESRIVTRFSMREPRRSSESLAVASALHHAVAELALATEYTYCLKDAYQVSLATEPQPVTAVVVGFRDDERRTRFLVHAFIRNDGTIAGSGLCDLKLKYDRAWTCCKTR